MRKSEFIVAAICRGMNWLIFLWCEMRQLFNQNYQIQRKKTRALKNTISKKRCFIIGNGPSLKKQDLTLLKDEICFCCNYMAMSELYDVIRPKHYVLYDPAFFSSDAGMKVLHTMLDRDFLPDLWIPIHAYTSWVDIPALAPFIEQNKLHAFFTSGSFFSDAPFTCDISLDASSCYTVTQMAAIIAAYLGAEEINLLGCDGTGILEDIDNWMGIVSSEHHFYAMDYAQDSSNGSKSQLYSSMKATFQGHTNIITGYWSLYLMCQKQGISLYNATEGGIIQFLPTRTLQDSLEAS